MSSALRFDIAGPVPRTREDVGMIHRTTGLEVPGFAAGGGMRRIRRRPRLRALRQAG